MRWQAIAACCVAVVGTTIAACGTGAESLFISGGDGGVDPGNDPPPGAFTPTESSPDDPGNSGCKPRTCAEANASCGQIGDGCDGVLDCNQEPCAADETCGGGGVANRCGKPACTPSTCADIGFECGQAGDGCGNSLSCGTCEGGSNCQGTPAKCVTGGGTTLPDGGACTPTKTACALGDCGFMPDGCGNTIDCSKQACGAGETCGGGGVADTCGKPPCVPKDCGTANCGFKEDGCGGVLNCWPTGPDPTNPLPPICGPGASCKANECQIPDDCTGLCQQQQQCAGGGTTSIEGYVTSPNGKLPVPNAVVYVPNGLVAAFQTGVTCESCATASGDPLISTTTDANGHFLLPNMPVSTPGKTVEIPVVVQLGRWRKQFTIETEACKNNLVPAYGAAPANKTAALPSTHAEGNIPLTAISTGSVDGLECVFRKMGVADSEFTDGNGTGRIRLYQDNGARVSSTSPQASALYNSTTEIDKYDAVIFGCVGSQSNKGATARDNVIRYANAGGRVFATHYSYVWLYSAGGYISPWAATATSFAASTEAWDATSSPGSMSAFVDTSFPKGTLFANWLQAPVGTPSPSYPPPYAPVSALWQAAPPMIALTEPRQDIKPQAPNLATSGIASPAQRWVYSTAAGSTVFYPNKSCTKGSDCPTGVCNSSKKCGSDPAAADAPMHYTFNTPWGAPAANQCGRVLFSDFHVSIGNTKDKTFPSECNSNPLTSQEKVLAYMLFDLASCVSTTEPPVCKPKTCTEMGVGCGLAGDGCGGQLSCGDCPPGQTCGGGGVPSQCGAPACTKKTCQANQCGKMGDGCGGQLDCGDCDTGTCGGGGANVCGAGPCTPSACPAPAAGSQCGPVANGCGGVNTCLCPANMPCVNGTCGTPACPPRTCEQAGANCGKIGDGCGKMIDCGTCVAPQTCGGSGTSNLCGGGVN